MNEWLQGTLDAWGYGGVVALMVLENVFPPIPSEVVMPYAGYAAARGDLSLWGVPAHRAPVERTRAGVAAGRDEVLEAAVAWASGGAANGGPNGD